MKRRLSYPNIVATLALVVAVGTGGAFAASQIDGGNLRDRSVPGKKLKRHTISRTEIKQRALRSLVQGGGSQQSGHVDGEAGGFPGSGGLLTSISTPLGQFRLSCGTANADARYVNTTPGAADVFRSFVGNDTGTDFDVVARNADVGYAATNATGPEQIDIRVGKGTRLGIMRVGASRAGTHCTFNWEFVSSG